MRIIFIIIIFFLLSCQSEEEKKMANYEKEIISLNEKIINNDKFDSLYFKRGNAYGNLSKYKESIKDYNMVIELNPKSRLSDNIGAIADYSIAIKLDSTNVNYYSERAEINRELNKHAEAIKDRTKIIQIEPSSENLLQRAYIKYDIEDYVGAVNDCQEAIRLDKKNSQAYFVSGHIRLHHFGSKQKTQGCLELSKAGELGHDKAYDLIKEKCN